MKPITRIDYYLAVISGDEDAVTPLPEPVTRIDHYLAYLAGENVAELPEPVTRIDFYLAKLCGMDVEIPEEPITRIDFYLAVLNGETVELPEAITRIDHYLDAWAEGGSLPWQTFTGNPLQFNAPKAHTLRSTVVTFTPKQDLHGYDNPWPAGGGKNLFNPSAMPTPTTSVQYHAFYVGDGTWTASTDAPYGDGNATVFFLAGNVSSGASTPTNGVSPSTGKTQTAVDGYVTVAWRTYNNINPSQYHIQIESGSSITSWTPFSNKCPISGWTGVDIYGAGENLLAKPFAYRPVPSKLSDCFFIKAGTYKFSFDTIGTATSWRFGVSMFDSNGNAMSDAAHKPWAEASYTASVAMWYGGVDSANKSVTLTYIEDCYTRIWFGSGNTSSGMEATNAMLNLGSTASPYTPPTISTTTLSFLSTVYGGTASVAEDGSGLGSGTMAFTTVADHTWTYFNGTTPFFYFSCADGKDQGAFVSSAYTRGSGNGKGIVTAQTLRIYDNRFTDPSEFKTAMSDVQIAYELAEPVPFTVTASSTPTAVQGINTMWTDGDTLTVEAQAEAVNLSALQSLNMLLGGRYVNNHTEDDLSDEEALDVILGGQR